MEKNGDSSDIEPAKMAFLQFLVLILAAISVHKSKQSHSKQPCTLHIKITHPQVQQDPQIPCRQIFPSNIGQKELTWYGTLF